MDQSGQNGWSLEEALAKLKKQQKQVEDRLIERRRRSAAINLDGSPTKFYKRLEHFGGRFKGTR